MVVTFNTFLNIRIHPGDKISEQPNKTADKTCGSGFDIFAVFL